MNLEPEYTRYITIIIFIVVFPIREYFIRKRIIKIHNRLRKAVPIKTNKIDLSGLAPVIKYSSTEQVLSKIESHLDKLK